MTKPKPKPTHTFRAVWPIVYGAGAVQPDADLIAQALADLPNVATRHHATIVGTPQATITEGRRIPGSGGHAHVVIAEAPATKVPVRAYQHARKGAA